MCCIFPRVEHALVFCVIFFCMCNVLWRYCVVFSARGTHSELLCYIFRAWNTLWNYCVIFSARRTRSGVIVLYFRAFHARKYNIA